MVIDRNLEQHDEVSPYKTIIISGVTFRTQATVLTGSQLKELRRIPADRAIMTVGTGEVRWIEDKEEVPIWGGAQFWDYAAPSKKKRVEFSVIASIIASIISIISFGYNYYSTRETSVADTIKESYRLFLDMNKMDLQYAQVMHVFCPSDVYPGVSDLVHRASSDLPSNEISKLLLQERAMADYAFATFEYSVFEYDIATKYGNSTRAKELKEVVDYFTGRLLRNPRLLYYWDPPGGNLSSEYEALTKQYYDNFVLHDKLNPLVEKADFTGPIPHLK